MSTTADPALRPDDQSPPDRLAYRWADLPGLLSMSESSLRRAKHRGEFPPPDRVLGRVPVWAKATLEAWLTGAGEKGGR